MLARDKYHQSVKNALIKDGWIITDDPLRLRFGGKDMYVDLGAERLLTAEKEGRQIAVEIKSFIGLSELDDVEKALGQYFVYKAVLAETKPEKTLYLGVPKNAYVNIFEEPFGQLMIKRYNVPLLIFDWQMEEIIKWID